MTLHSFLRKFVLLALGTVLPLALSLQASEKAAKPPQKAVSDASPASETITVPAAEAPAESATVAVWASRMLGYLHTDDDQQSSSGAKVVEGLIESGQLPEARTLAEKIAGFRRAAQLFRVAEAFAKTGKKEQAAECRDVAQSGRRDERDFEREEVAGARIQALAAAGELKQARDEIGNLVSKVARHETEASLFAYDREAGVAERVAAFVTQDDIAPSLRGTALLFVAESQAALGETTAAKDHADRAIHMVCKLADPRTIPQLNRAVGLLAKLGATKDAARWAEVCLGFAERTDAKAFWKARDLRLAAESLLTAGEKEKAAVVLKQIPNAPGKLDVFTYSRGAMEAAEAFLLAGQPEMFEKAAVHVLKMSRTHPHYRARAMAAMDVLASCARHRVALSPAVEAELAATARAIETDPHYLKPA